MTLQTIHVTVLANNPKLTIPGGTFFAPAAKRVGPSRDRQWAIQRIRVVAQVNYDFVNSDSDYMMWSGLHSATLAFCGFGSWPVGGVWLNSIQPENEIVWSGCVPPRQESYDPQQPVNVSDSDNLICTAADATNLLLSGSFGYGQWKTGQVSVSWSIDVDDTPAHNRGN